MRSGICGKEAEWEEARMPFTRKDGQPKARNLRRKELLIKEKISKVSLRGEISLNTNLFAS